MSPPITLRSHDPMALVDATQQRRQPTDSPPTAALGDAMDVDPPPARPISPPQTSSPPFAGEDEVIVQITREKMRSKLSVSRRSSSSLSALAILSSNWARSPSPSSSAHSPSAASSGFLADSFLRGRSAEIASIFSHRAPFTGLDNLGNTCYINSLLQVLYYTPYFRQELQNLTGEISKSRSANGSSPISAVELPTVPISSSNGHKSKSRRSNERGDKHTKSKRHSSGHNYGNSNNSNNSNSRSKSKLEIDDGDETMSEKDDDEIPIPMIKEEQESTEEEDDFDTNAAAAALEQEVRMLSAISRLFLDMESVAPANVAMATGACSPSLPHTGGFELSPPSCMPVGRSPSVRPWELVQLLRTGGGRFANEQQHDVQEFLRYLLAFVQKIEHETESRKEKLRKKEESKKKSILIITNEKSVNRAVENVDMSTSADVSSMEIDENTTSSASQATPEPIDSSLDISDTNHNDSNGTKPKRRRRRKAGDPLPAPTVVYQTRRRARTSEKEGPAVSTSTPPAPPLGASTAEGSQPAPSRKRKAARSPTPTGKSPGAMDVEGGTGATATGSEGGSTTTDVPKRRRKRQRVEPPARTISTRATPVAPQPAKENGTAASPQPSLKEAAAVAAAAFAAAAADAAGFVERLFRGQLVNEVKCQECENSSQTTECFFDLSVPLAGSAGGSPNTSNNNNSTTTNNTNNTTAAGGAVGSVDAALAAFLATERLQGANKYACPTCRTFTEAVRSVRFCSLPPVLTLHIKRFFDDASSSGMMTSAGASYGSGGAAMSMGAGGGNRRKLCQPVLCPATLSLSMTPVVRCHGSSSTTTAPPIPVEYELFAVIFHSGYWLSSGHYFAFIKVPAIVQPTTSPTSTAASVGGRTLGGSGSGDSSTGSWVCFDDSQVTFCSEAELNKLMRGANGADDKNTSYILFYKRLG